MKMEDKSNHNFWDAKRMIREYAHVAWILNDSIPFERISYVNQIKLRRIASVICAYLNIKNKYIDVIGLINSVFAYVENREVMSNSPMSHASIAQLIESLCEMQKIENKDEFRYQFTEQVREQLFWMVLRYRVQADDLQSTFSNVQECNKGGAMAVLICNYLYNPMLDVCNEQLERLLALLLGQTFDGQFSTEQLVANFNFPTTTDEELVDLLVDNL